MSLKSKIIAISSAVLIIALTLSNMLILFTVKRSMLNEAISNERYNAITTGNNFNEYVGNVQRSDKETIYYYFKKLNNDYIVCFNLNGGSVDECFNRTIYTYNDIISAINKYNSKLSSNNYVPYYILDKQRKVYVFECSVNTNFLCYYLVDLRSVYNKIYILTGITVISSLAILITAIIALYFIIKKSFKPLGVLSKKANSIANGNYSDRIDIKQKDEIGRLSIDFNKMAESIENHNNKLEEEAEKRLLFMGNLTHELKTPLTAIQGYSETMLGYDISDEDKMSALSYIYSECKRLNRLSKKMLNILELENNEEIVIKDIKVQDIFNKVYESCSTLANEKKVKLEIFTSDMRLSTDIDLITDVLINLCDNAIKASNNGSKVMLYTENKKIIVEDFGCGIPEQEISKIVDPFYRVDKSRSRKSGGSGLGLYLTSLILKKLDMKFDIESTVGEGTKVIIYNSFK